MLQDSIICRRVVLNFFVASRAASQHRELMFHTGLRSHFCGCHYECEVSLFSQQTIKARFPRRRRCGVDFSSLQLRRGQWHSTGSAAGDGWAFAVEGSGPAAPGVWWEIREWMKDVFRGRGFTNESVSQNESESVPVSEPT